MGVAQEKNSISLSYGFISLDQAAFSVGSSFIGAFSGAKRADNMSLALLGPVVLSYHRTLNSNERFSLGGSLTLFDQGKLSDKTDGSIISFNTFTLAPEAKLMYLNPNNMLNIYGLVGIGVTLGLFKDYEDRSNDVTATHFNFQLTPLAIEYGEKTKGFAELGFGYKGILNVGVKYGF